MTVMMKLRRSLAALLVLVWTPVLAGENPVVVELFTSQGCSSCPPADALMHELAKRDDVVPLALHVDYWDYIGWKDEFADPAFGRRQKGYAHAAGRDMVYTPQMIVDGQDELVGAHAMRLANLIDARRERPDTATLTATRSSGTITVRVAPVAGTPSGSFNVQLVRFTPLEHTNITRGENAGRELDYANVVNSWRTVGQWDGRSPTVFEAKITGADPAVVLVQSQGFGPIVAAAMVQ